MSNESHGEFADWAGKLDAPGALAGEGLTDREATWEQLYQRLHKDERPARRPFLLLRFRWAAACLLLVLIAAALLFRKGPGKGATADKQQPAPPAPYVFTPGTRVPSVETPLQGSSVPPPADPSPRKPSLRSYTHIKRKDLLLTAPVRETPPSPADSLTVSLSPSPAFASAPPARKKELKVVTLNDVSDPAGPETLTADRQRHHKLRFNIGYPAEIRPAMADQQPANKPYFIIKLSSQKP